MLYTMKLNEMYGGDWTKEITLDSGLVVVMSTRKSTVQQDIMLGEKYPWLSTDPIQQIKAALDRLKDAIVSWNVEDEVSIETLKMLSSDDLKALIEAVPGFEKKTELPEA